MAQQAFVQLQRQVQGSTAMDNSVLQIKCNKCSKKKKKPTLQRSKVSPAPEMMPTVPEEQRPSAAVDAATYAFTKPPSSHDFSQIPVHSRLHGRIQAKLAVNTPGDIYEQEADRVADQVMATPGQAVRSAPPQIQRLAESSGRQMEAPESVGLALASPGRPLESGLRQEMEEHFGYDFSRVRVHSDAAAGLSARDVNARAYTAGNNIVFASGRFAPSTGEGRRLLAHELAHVAQQSAAEGIHSGPRGGKPILSADLRAVQRKVECSLEHIEKECAGAASSCMTVKDYCEKKYPNKEDIDNLHANAVKGATEYKSKFPKAADNLLHFLNGSGKEKVMNVDIFRNHPATQQKYGDHMAKFIEGAKRRFMSGQLKIGGPAVEMVWTDTANAFSSDYGDLGLAVGGYTLCSKVSAKALDPKDAGGSKDYLWLRFDPWTIQAFDCYNWDPGKGIGLPFATDNDLCCLENAGRAKHFRIRTDPWPLAFPHQSVRIAEEKPPEKPPAPPPSKSEESDR
jgi:hypothetical protein